MSLNVAYAAMAGILPSFIWLWFWLREDGNPEPKWLLVLTFLSGIVTVIIAVFVEQYIATIVSDPELKYTLWAAVEEIVKIAAVLFIAFMSRFFDEPVDALIYSIVAALGFSAIENALFIYNPLANGEIAQGLLTSNMRFIGATLVHTVSTAAIGFGIGWTFYRGIIAKAIGFLIGLVLAISIHASFNIAVVNGTSGDALKAFAWIWGAVVVLIVLFEEVKAVKPRSVI